VDEIKAVGGDAIAVGGNVAADDFPAKILDATIRYATPISPVTFFFSLFRIACLILFFQAVRQAESHRQ